MTRPRAGGSSSCCGDAVPSRGALAVGASRSFPLTIRYGRAFQPDAAMLGATVAGLACWDRWESGGRRYWLAAGWLLLALGFAIKIIAAFLLIPLVFVILRRRRTLRILTACTTLLPALAWYLWADHLVGGGRLPGLGRQPRHLAGTRRAFRDRGARPGS